MNLRDSLVAILVAFLWGAQVTAVKIGGVEFPPILMVGMRFTIIAIILLPFVGLPKLPQMKKVFLIATVSGALHFGLLYCGIVRMSASTSAIVYQLATPFTVVLACLFLGEKILMHTIAGIVLAIVGVIIVMGGMGAGGELLGFVLVALAALVFACGTILTKKWGPFNPLAMNGWVAAFAAPELIFLSYMTEYKSWGSVMVASNHAWLALLYTAISGGLIGFALWYWLLSRHQVSKLTPFTLLVPVFAVLVSQLMLKESITYNLVIGGVIALIGVALCQYKPKALKAK